MTYRADPDFLTELKKYGDVNIEACFNCGNCTAVCPLSSEDDNFPRRMIRYAQLGMPDRLLNNKALWLCYSCGECSQTCPRQAGPAELMAASRRCAIARYDRLGLARALFTSTWFNLVFTLLLGIVLAGFMYTAHGPMTAGSLRLFAFIPAAVIHNLGLAVILIVVLAGLAGAINMIYQAARNGDFARGVRLNWLEALWETIEGEVLGQRRYRQDCETTSSSSPWYLQKWFAHASMLWGFLGLLAATVLDYGLDLAGVKPTGTWVPIWYPIRLMGSLAGVFLVYGVSLVIYKRLARADASYRNSVPSDWTFLVLLWLAGVSGFVVELALYLPSAPSWAYWMLLFHVTVAMELVLLAPFTKFAHAFYRTTALYLQALKSLPEKLPSGTSGAD
jgi:ferredoxin